METDKAPQGKSGVTRNIPAVATPAKDVQRPWRIRLFRRRTVVCPTWLGLVCIVAIFFILIAAWIKFGESILAATHRVPPEVLVVEGWIGREGLRAAVDEFEHGGYRYIVASGGLTSGRWEDKPESYAVMAAREMIRLGVPEDKVVVAISEDTESHRTFESAVAVWQALRKAKIQPKDVTVYTLGPHASRSALVFAKVLGPETSVGVIGWQPASYQTEAWWKSSERSRELLEETAGYLFEVLFNSGRRSNAPQSGTSN